jgi:hypothetical protein
MQRQNKTSSPALNVCSPRGVPIPNNARIITTRLCAAAEIKYLFWTFSNPVTRFFARRQTCTHAQTCVPRVRSAVAADSFHVFPACDGDWRKPLHAVPQACRSIPCLVPKSKPALPAVVFSITAMPRESLMLASGNFDAKNNRRTDDHVGRFHQKPTFIAHRLTIDLCGLKTGNLGKILVLAPRTDPAVYRLRGGVTTLLFERTRAL